MRRISSSLLLSLVLGATACSGSDDGNDSGPVVRLDASAPDATISIPDGGTVMTDTGVRPDTGIRADAGFPNPETILEGRHEVDMLPMWFRIDGTLTSTMPPALVVHDGPYISHEYAPEYMKELLPGRTMVYFDLRATGRTSFGVLGSSSSTITLAQHARDMDRVVSFVSDFADVSQVDLLGHGYGAAVAALWAADNPTRVSRMVLTTPYAIANVPFRVDSIGEGNRRLTSPDRERLSAIQNRPECLQDFSQCFLEMFAVWGPRQLCPENYEQFYDLNFRHGSIRTEFFVGNQLVDSNYDLRDMLRSVAAPTTIISGLCDTVSPENAREWANVIPDATLIELPGAGRFPHVETSTTWTRILQRALIYP